MRLNRMKCDRCGTEYEPYSHICANLTHKINEQGNRITEFEQLWFNSVKLWKEGKEFTHNGEYKHFDLCEVCAKLLYNWLTKKEV